jgi:hypothetical protein
MNEANRLIVTLLAAAVIVLMAVVIFLAWAAPDETIDRIGDFAEFLADNNTSAGQLIVTLGALAVAVLALLIIVIELAPEDDPKELRVEQAGATTIVPADALRLRLEEALLGLPDVTAARSRVWSKSRGITASLELTVTQNANLSAVSQEAARVVIDTVQTDLGLPVAESPTVKFAFGGSRSIPPIETPIREPAPLGRVETVDERISGVPEESTPPPGQQWGERPESAAAEQPELPRSSYTYGQPPVRPTDETGEETSRP